MRFSQKKRQDLIKECRDKLLSLKSDILNRVKIQQKEFTKRDFSSQSGDEADQTVFMLEENEFLLSQQRLQRQLIEIDLALDRILRGTFGVCEETEEIIEAERLRLIPWTTLSIEGAEIREARKKLYAK